MNLQTRTSLLAVLCVLLPAGLAAEQVHYASNWNSDWRHQLAGDSCQLVLEIGIYGEARFVGAPGSAPVFEMQAHRDLHAVGPISVTQYAPAWHPAAGLRRDLGQLLHIEGGGAIGRGQVAHSMLGALQLGNHLEIAAPAWYDGGQRVVLDVNARSLIPSLHNFLECAHTEVAVSWEKMSRTRIGYEVDEHGIDATSRERLAAIARFVKEDPSISAIYIDGHTDDSGTSRKNYELSKRRAETVAKILENAGIERDRLVVRYHGEVYPVADNKNVSGKAKNRRTTVRLERNSGHALAGQ